MKERILRLSKNKVFSALPKESVGALPIMLVSVEMGISIVLGYAAARFFAGAKTNVRGRIPSIIFSLGRYGVHLHHWLLFSGVFATTLIWGFSVIAPTVFYGFLGGVIAQGIIAYEDWTRVIFKMDK